MKRALLYIGILFSTVSCGRTLPRLQSGDLLFQVGKASAMSGAIAAATGKDSMFNYTHVGIAVVHGKADSVIEATTEGGVRVVALADYLARAEQIGGRPAVVAKRLRDTAGIAAAIIKARSYRGLPYDYSFRPGNGQFYCSELVWESFRTPGGAHLFPARPMNFRSPDGTMPSFWTELFEQLGEPIPQGIPGTNPNDMAREPILTETGRWF